MKVLKSGRISPFGGLNFVLEELDKLGIGHLLNRSLPELGPQSLYSWRDVIYSYWSVFLCGGDCAEDLNLNFRSSFNHPNLCVPSADRVLNRMKELTIDSSHYIPMRRSTEHRFAINNELNNLNILLCKRLTSIGKQKVILDYDNTICYTGKKDANKTYKHESGYQPGVGFIGRNVIYVENRNGNSSAHVGQDQTLKRMFTILQEQGIKVGRFRADSASYTYEIIETIRMHSELFYLRARMSQTLEKAISKVEHWFPIQKGEDIVYRGETTFTPFMRVVRGTNKVNDLQSYRLIITKEKRRDGQINVFTGEPYIYSAIMTNDNSLTTNQVVEFYNQRGSIEKEFEVLKYDFGWNKLPFSYLEQNNVYLLITAMCRNIYDYLIRLFATKTNALHPSFRLKKFIFRFICVPAKWTYKARSWHLRVYSDKCFKT